MATRRAGIASACPKCAAARHDPAHQGDALAEMVCSNSFRSDDGDSMPSACSTARCVARSSCEADATKVPADRLGSHRDLFSRGVSRSKRIRTSPSSQRIDTLPGAGLTIVATGPLTPPRSPTASAPRRARTHCLFGAISHRLSRQHRPD